MIKTIRKLITLSSLCVLCLLASPGEARAEVTGGPGISSGSYIVTVSSASANVTSDKEGTQVLFSVPSGTRFQIEEDMGNGSVKIKLGNSSAYLPVDGAAVITEADQATLEAVEAELIQAKASREAEKAADFRQSVVDYALQFVGGKYKSGGKDPHTGADCSGFTWYVMKHAAGINLNPSSRGQATQGTPVSADQMKPGDLVFYSSGGAINHVALYIGNGQVVHASTYATGIKISPWNYRTPVKIVNVIGE